MANRMANRMLKQPKMRISLHDSHGRVAMVAGSLVLYSFLGGVAIDFLVCVPHLEIYGGAGRTATRNGSGAISFCGKDVSESDFDPNQQ